MQFFVGLHQPSDARHFAAVCVSVHRLRTRRHFVVQEWIMDSGAFTTLALHGGYPDPPGVYAKEIRRWKDCGTLLAAVTQDYMCEPFMLTKTGLTVAAHQRLTIERYDALLQEDTGVYILPVLQGYHPHEYLTHLDQYGARLAESAWVGIGSVCKRNGTPHAVEQVLLALHHARPDLRLHGFGLKITALASGLVQDLLFSADSMAWSYHARKQGRNPNNWEEAARLLTRLDHMAIQLPLFAPTDTLISRKV